MTSEKTAIVQLRRNDFAAELREHIEAIRQVQPQAPEDSGSPALNQLGQELEQLGQWLTRRFNELVQLLQISSELNKGLLLDDILARIYTFFNDVIPYERIGCALIDEDGENVTAYWAKFTYANQPQITPGYSAPLAGSSLESIITSGQPRIINDLEAYLAEHPDSESTRRIVEEGIRSSLTCPLLADGRPVGFLFFSSTEKYTYDGLHQEVFLYIASQVSHLIEKSRLYQKIVELNERLVAANQQLHERASRDALTGVLNRGAIMEFLQQQLNAEQRPDLAVLMLDIDFFKKVNDNYGHVQGDLVLRTVAATINEHIRPNDRVGRYGGEEFLVVLRSIDDKQSLAVAERIRQAVEACQIKAAEVIIKVTISVGVAILKSKQHSQLTELLENADKQLYLAKENGRNQVCYN